ncbi:Uncharacterized protein TCM_001615 [Theobroma cacao]|uniref:Uncharacterized protein n=1 Tax=Theobroma cacao TaxID=3641 RepID=A0A061DKZ6_THECC|nr:Uncharacterized protein TCM_001615 [Theobroma cacao]
MVGGAEKSKKSALRIYDERVEKSKSWRRNMSGGKSQLKTEDKHARCWEMRECATTAQIQYICRYNCYLQGLSIHGLSPYG